jgi:hypothetical protein
MESEITNCDANYVIRQSKSRTSQIVGQNSIVLIVIMLDYTLPEVGTNKSLINFL